LRLVPDCVVVVPVLPDVEPPVADARLPLLVGAELP
jgi:hypothetical protein